LNHYELVNIYTLKHYYSNLTNDVLPVYVFPVINKCFYAIPNSFEYNPFNQLHNTAITGVKTVKSKSIVCEGAGVGLYLARSSYILMCLITFNAYYESINSINACRSYPCHNKSTTFGSMLF